MLAIRPRSHNPFLLALLLLIATLLLLLVPADPAHAATDPNEPADNDVVSATRLVWWVQVETATRGECAQVIWNMASMQ